MVTLNDLGLAAGDPVRFRTRDAGKWIEGRAVGVNPDGSVVIGDQDRASRSIMPDMIRRQARGPRGGTVWATLEQTKESQ